MNASQKSYPVIFIILMLMNGCSQSPTSVGAKLIPGSARYSSHDTTIAAVGDTSFKFSQANGSGASLLVGNYASVNATSLLLFAAYLPDTLTTVQIDTAELTLTSNYGWHVSLPPVPAQFQIKEVLSSWSSSTVTADSLSTIAMAPTNSALVTITSQDTLSSTLAIVTQIDTSLVRRWINISADTLLPRFFSLALVPAPGTVNCGVWGFSNFNSSTPPTLTIIYEKNGVKDSTSLTNGVGTFLAASSPILPSAGIQTQGGISEYSIIKFNLKPPLFDSVASNRIIVNNATMSLTLKNSQSSVGYGSIDSVVAYLAGSATQLDSVGSSYYGYGYRKDTSQTTNSVYIFNITSMVQQWINVPSGNFGAELRALGGSSNVDRHVFYSSADSVYGPKLSITYTKK